MPEQALSLVLMDPSGNRVLLDSTPVEDVAAQSGDANAPAKKPDEEPAGANPMAHARILSTELPAEQALVRVKGPATFYHLVQNNPSSSSEQDSEEQSEEDKGGEDDGESSEEKDDEQDDGSGDDKKEPEDEQEGDEKDGGEEKGDQEPEQKEDQEGQSGDQSKDDEQEPQPSDMPPPEGAQDAEMQRVEDILRALEDSDNNFQMRKALENTPGRYIEKDW